MLKEIGWLLALAAAEKLIDKIDDSESHYNVVHNYGISTGKYRETIPLSISNYIDHEQFEKIALECKRRIRRINHIEINNSIIKCTVISQSGISEWDFSVDFNDWGYITGEYWYTSDNLDSDIPNVYGKLVSNEIKKYYSENYITTFSINYLVETCEGIKKAKSIDELEYIDPMYKNRSLFTKEYFIDVRYDSGNFVGKHLLIVFATLFHSGFKKIICKPFEINGYDTHYNDYEVKEVLVNDGGRLVKETKLSVYSTITIYYYKLTYKTSNSIKDFFSKIFS